MLHKLCILLLVFCAFGNELLQIYILLYSKYEVTSSILLENLTSCFWNAYIREKKKFSYTNTSDFENLMFNFDAFIFKLKNILEVAFQNLKILCSNSEVHRKYIFKINVFLFKLRIILEVDFQYSCIYFEIQRYTWSRL